MTKRAHKAIQKESIPSTEYISILGKVRQVEEYETKFHIPPKFIIPEHLGVPLSPRVFTSTYYDSVHQRMGQLGLTLRRRVERGQGVWQLKIPSGHHRIELEVESGSRQIPSQFLDLLIAFFRTTEPVPIGKLRTWRTGVSIWKAHKLVAEVTLDSVALIHNNKIVGRFQEIELETKEGDAKEIPSFEKALEKAGARKKPLQPKIFQALKLSYPLAPPHLGTSTPLHEHIQGNLSGCLRQILLNDPGTRLGRDNEALHQMRVGTRRMRALLRTSRPFLSSEWTHATRREVRWIGSLLGRVRDCDVLLENIQLHFPELPQSNPRAFDWVLSTLKDQRSVARAHLLKGLRSDRYLQLLNHLEESLPRLTLVPSSFTLIDVTRKSIQKLLTTINKTGGSSRSDELHRIRILLKRTRYAVEIALPFLGKPGKSYLQQAKRSQEFLGNYQDAIVCEQRILEFQHHRPPNHVRFVSGMMIERLRTFRTRLLKKTPNHWEKLNKSGKKL